MINGWKKIEFFDTKGFSEEQIYAAKELMTGGFSIGNSEKRLSAEYCELENNGFAWGQMRISYQKSVVSCPYVVRKYDGEIYVLYNHNYQPAAKGFFDETARGFATMIGDRIETTMETSIRIIRQKTNLLVTPEMIFRTSCPINTDPSWNEIPEGLSFVACKLPPQWFYWKKSKCHIYEEFLIDPKKGQPKIARLKDFLDFETKIESSENVQCGLSRQAALALYYYLQN